VSDISRGFHHARGKFLAWLCTYIYTV